MKSIRVFLFLLISQGMITAASAHTISEVGESGFVHPFTGLDHFLTAFAIGLLISKFESGKFLLPVTFVLGMGIGCLAGFSHYQTAYTEGGILFSLVMCVFLVLTTIKFHLKFFLPVMLLFGFFHGQAHGTELHGSTYVLATELIIATFLIHLLGYGTIAIARRYSQGHTVLRICGAGMACIAVFLIFNRFL